MIKGPKAVWVYGEAGRALLWLPGWAVYRAGTGATHLLKPAQSLVRMVHAATSPLKPPPTITAFISLAATPPIAIVNVELRTLAPNGGFPK